MGPEPIKASGPFRLAAYALAALAAVVAVLFVFRMPLRVDLSPAPNRPPEKVRDQAAYDALLALRSALVVSPEPGFAERELGATLLMLKERGVRLDLIVVTDGQSAAAGEVDQEARARQADSAHAWGAAEVVFLGFPGGTLDGAELEDRLLLALRRIQPQAVFAPDHAFAPVVAHRDAPQVGETVERLARAEDACEWLFFAATRSPNVFVDAAPHWPTLEPLLSDPEAAEEKAASRGQAVGLDLAEGLRAVHLR